MPVFIEEVSVEYLTPWSVCMCILALIGFLRLQFTKSLFYWSVLSSLDGSCITVTPLLAWHVIQPD